MVGEVDTDNSAAAEPGHDVMARGPRRTFKHSAVCSICGKAQLLTLGAIRIRERRGRSVCFTCSIPASQRIARSITCGRCGRDRVLKPAAQDYVRRTGRNLCLSCAQQTRQQIHPSKPAKDATGQHGWAWRGGVILPKVMVTRWQNGAEARGLEWMLTLEQIERIWFTQEGRCALTGLPLTLDRGQNTRVSLDRIDSSQGYTIANVRLVCACVNFMKQDYADGDFLQWCRLIVRRADVANGVANG